MNGAAPSDADRFRLLGDEARLRILRVLARERLNLSELVRVLGLAQSSISRHVKKLREGGLLVESREGGWTWLALAPEEGAALGAVWPPIRARLARAPDRDGDDARLATVLREREERRVGWGSARKGRAEPGRSWSAWARALGHLVLPLVVADLGCGDGALTLEVARWAARVVGIDPDPAALRRARALARKAGGKNVTWMRGDLAAVPLPEAHVDLALLSQTLHAQADPAAAVREAARVTRPGGRVLVLDLLVHEEAWVVERLGHRWLGFDEDRVAVWLSEAGLVEVRIEEAARRRGNPFVVLVASGVKREDGRRTSS